MSNTYSMDDLLDFLGHASDRGLLPAATASSLAVATRNVLGILTEEERNDLRKLDLDDVVKRFHNKRARDFSPGSLTEYGRRLHRAMKLFADWRENPAGFSVKTRATAASAGKQGKSKSKRPVSQASSEEAERAELDTGEYPASSGYRTAVPIRPGLVVSITNLPVDLTKSEAERLTEFIRMLAVE